jgi:HK97 gp10 family phage protein
MTDSAPHASKLEFGTVKMDAEPFLGPAIDHGKNDALKAMAEKIEKQLNKAGV